MKIAVLLFGHLRDFTLCADSLKQFVLDKYDCDVFIHTWDQTEHSTVTWHEQRFNPLQVTDSIKGQIYEKYQPKDIEIEHQEKYAKEKIVASAYHPDYTFSTEGMHYMFYSMGRVNELRKKYQRATNTEYDIVLVTRPDIMFLSEFDIESMVYQANTLGLDSDSCRYFAFMDAQCGYWQALLINGSNDLLFFGKPEVIDKYIEVNKDIPIKLVSKYSFNIVSIFTAMEIHAGLMPVPISYRMGPDWSYSGSRNICKVNNCPKWKKTIFHIGALLLWPIFRLQKNHSWLNYYVYKERFAE